MMAREAYLLTDPAVRDVVASIDLTHVHDDAHKIIRA